MAALRSLARRLARTKLGQKALNRPNGLSFLKQKPGKRVFFGLALMLLSFLTTLPALALLSYLSVKMGKPMIIGIGGPAVLVLVHVIFGAGVYLAGQNYASEMFLWATRRFLQKFT